MTLKLSPKRLAAGVSTIMALYTLARVSVLFFEALATVRDARNEDQELLDLCVRGEARGSAKMRDACLKARAELASPAVFKAITLAVSTAFKDFSDTVGSPFKLSIVVVFLLGSVVLPVVPWLRLLLGQHQPDQPPQHWNTQPHFITLAPPPDTRSRFRKKIGGAIKALKLRRGPVIEEVDDDDNFDSMESTKPQYPSDPSCSTGAWTSIDINGHHGHNGHTPRPHSPNHSKWE